MIKNREEIKRVLAEPITPMARKPTLNDLPRKLRGPSNNKYGGHQCQHMRAFRGSKFGAASAGKESYGRGTRCLGNTVARARK